MKTKTEKPPTGRDKILDVSIRLFAEHGFSGVGMRNIAEESGITLPSIYHHFGNKEELYRAVETKLYSQHASSLLKVLHSAAAPEDKLRDFVKNLVEILVASPNYLKIMQRDLIEGKPDNHEFLVQMSIQGVFDELRQLLEKCTKGSGDGIQPIFLFSTILGFLTMRPVTMQIANYKFSKKSERQQLNMLVELVLKVVTEPQK
jgi:TetR/AcrR family transcriptional regulator